MSHRDDLRGLLEQELSARPTAEWAARFSAAGVPAGPVNDIAAAFEPAEALELHPIVERLIAAAMTT